MTDKNPKFIEGLLEIIKFRIENLSTQIQELRKTRQNLIFIFSTIIIAFWTILGALITQLIGDKNFNVCIKYNITNCMCDCSPSLTYKQLMNVCADGTNTCQNLLCNVSLFEREFSIYQYLLNLNTFNMILFLGTFFSIIMILVWRWTEHYFYFEEKEKQELIKQHFEDFRILVDIPQSDKQKFLKIDPFKDRDPINYGVFRFLLLIFTFLDLFNWINTNSTDRFNLLW